MKIQHKKLGIDIEMPEILQGALEDFEKEIHPAIEDINENGLLVAKFNSVLVRAACKVGWLPGFDVESIPTTQPATITFIANNVSEAVTKAREIPPQ